MVLSETNKNQPLKIVMSFQGRDIKLLEDVINETLKNYNVKNNDLTSLDSTVLTSIETNAQEFVSESCDLFKAILSDNNLTISDIKRIDFCFKSEFTSLISNLFERYLNENNVKNGNYFWHQSLNYLESITKTVSLNLRSYYFWTILKEKNFFFLR